MSLDIGSVTETWSRVLGGGAQTSADTDFFAAGGDSLALVELIESLESARGSAIDLDFFLEEPTLGRLVRACTDEDS